MIIRNALIRQGTSIQIHLYEFVLTVSQGRRTATTPARSWTRCLATEVDIKSIESSLDNALKETKSIESEIQKHTDKLVPQIDNETHASVNLREDGTAQGYNKLQRHSTSPLSIVSP